MCHFSSLCSSMKVSLAGLLCKEIKRYPVLQDRQMKGYRKKDVVSNVLGMDGIRDGIVFRTQSNICDDAFLQKQLTTEIYFCKNSSVVDVHFQETDICELFTCEKTPSRHYLDCFTSHKKEIRLRHLHKRTNPEFAPDIQNLRWCILPKQ